MFGFYSYIYFSSFLFFVLYIFIYECLLSIVALYIYMCVFLQVCLCALQLQLLLCICIMHMCMSLAFVRRADELTTQRGEQMCWVELSGELKPLARKCFLFFIFYCFLEIIGSVFGYMFFIYEKSPRYLSNRNTVTDLLLVNCLLQKKNKRNDPNKSNCK